MDDCPVCEKMLLPGPFRIHIHLGTAKHIGMSLLKTVTVHELRDSKRLLLFKCGFKSPNS